MANTITRQQHDKLEQAKKLTEEVLAEVQPDNKHRSKITIARLQLEHCVNSIEIQPG